MKKLGLILAFLLISASYASAALVESEENYDFNGKNFKAFLVYDDKFEGKLPGVMIVHEWWGHNEYARKRARMLAAEGYLAFAMDMYGDGKKAEHPDDAGKFAKEVASNLEEIALPRFSEAMTLFMMHPRLDVQKIGAIGYCFGGSVVLHMARSGLNLDVVGSFHGSLGGQKAFKKDAFKGKLYVFTGADDKMIPQSQVEEFISEVETAEVNFQLKVYPGVKHSFTNPDADKIAAEFGLPLAYDKKADKDSWKQLLKGFKEAWGQ